MAVVSCQVSVGEFTSQPLLGLDSEYEIPYIVKTDAITDNAATIESSGVLHPRFTPFDDNIFATLRRISCRKDPKSPWWNAVWRCVEHYSSVPLTQKEKDQQIADPRLRPAEIEWEEVPYERPILWGMQDATRQITAPNGELITVNYERVVPILNSAGDFPDQIPVDTDYFWQATVTKNVDGIPADQTDYGGAICDAPFTLQHKTGEAEGVRLVNHRLSSLKREGTYQYYIRTMTFEFREPREKRTPSEVVPKPFDLELPDMGLHSRTTSWSTDLLGNEIPTFGPQIRIKTDDSPPRPVAMAVPLDGAGQKLLNPTPDNIVFLPPWRKCRKRDFSVLPVT